jgi:hypothetical protein
MTFIHVAKPTLFERWVVLGVQWVFYLAFFALYLVSPRTAHRVVGYFEEEAVINCGDYPRHIRQIGAASHARALSSLARSAGGCGHGLPRVDSIFRVKQGKVR